MLNRIKGLLVGCAYGDALGMPSEMMSKETFEKAFPNGIDRFMPSTPYDFIGRKFKAGQVTDDTINVLIVCDSIIKNNGVFNVDKYIELLMSWIKDNQEKYKYIVGPSTLKALESIKNGTPIYEAGKFGTTNGAAMKVSPIGIICDYNDLKDLISNVENLCLPTHNTNIAITGASVIAAIVSYVIRGGKSIDDIWNLAYQVIDECKFKGNDLPSPSLKLRLESVEELVKNNDEATIMAKLETFYGVGMETVETIPAVLALLTLSDLKPHKCAIISANLCGDTDTIGSISTSICAAINNDFSDDEIHKLSEINSIDFTWYSEKLFKCIKQLHK